MPDRECIPGPAYIPAIAAHSDAASKETVWAPHICPLPSSTEPTLRTGSRRKPKPAWAIRPSRWCSSSPPTARWAPTRCSPNTPSGSTPEKLRGFYADMAKIRRFDVEATALQRQGQLALWVPLTGQEAAQIGSGRASQPQDYIFPTYREHGVALTRNVDLAELLRQFRGVSNGGWNPKDTNFHLYTLVLAAQTPHAVGYAMGIQRDQKFAASAALADGTPARPRSPRLPSWSTSATAPAPKATSTSPWCSPPPTRPPWCSSARTTTGRSPSPAPCRPASRWPTAPRATASRASGWTETT